MTPERVAALVARWVRFYTRDLPTRIGGRRVAEIEADLHDHIAYERANRTSDGLIAVSILSRMFRGVAADVSWREQHAKAVDPLTIPGGPIKPPNVMPPTPSGQRPLSVTVLATIAAVGGVGAVWAVLAGAFVLNGLANFGTTDKIIVLLPSLALGTLNLAFAYGAWTLKSWGWALGVVVGTASIVFITVTFASGWAELMRDAGPLTLLRVIAAVVAAAGLFIWFRPATKVAFERA